MNRQSRAVVLTGAVLFLLASVSLPAAQALTYYCVPIPGVAGTNGLGPTLAKDANVVTGFAFDAKGVAHACLVTLVGTAPNYGLTGPELLPVPRGFAGAVAGPISADGKSYVAGQAWKSSVWQGVVWDLTRGKAVLIGSAHYTSQQATGVNNSGVVVGSGWRNVSRWNSVAAGFEYSLATGQLVTVDGAGPGDINDSGQIAGTAPNTEQVRWDAGLDASPTHNSGLTGGTGVMYISKSGVSVFTTQVATGLSAYVWDPAPQDNSAPYLVQLPPLLQDDNLVVATGIADVDASGATSVVGRSGHKVTNPDGSLATVWKPFVTYLSHGQIAATYDLNDPTQVTLIWPSGFGPEALTSAGAVNDKGCILASGPLTSPSGAGIVVLLVPAQ